MHKKILSGTLAAMMLVSPAYAIDIAGGTGETPVHLTQEATQFSVTVPTVLPVDVSATGVITVANNNKIINNSFGPVEVKSVAVESLKDWTLVDFNTDFKTKKVGLHEYGFQMNNTNVQPDGSCAAEFDVISGNEQINFVYDSKVATQNTALSKENIANVIFTIGWSDKNTTRPQLNATHKPDKAKMDAALKNLTGKITFTTTAYSGSDGIDISEAEDGSVMAVISGRDATVYSEGGVLGIDTIDGNSRTAMFFDYNAREMDLHGLDMSKVVNGLNMFAYCKFATLNLSGIDMGQMTNAHGMFARCDFLKTINLSNTNMSSVTSAYAMFDFCPSLTTLDLSDVNMSQVMNTASMFQSCTALTTLDLSGINMSKETDTTAMFDGCFALRTCYAKTQQDCDKLNNSGTSGWPKPSNVNFIVKPAA